MVFRSHPEWTVTEPVRNIGKIVSCNVTLVYQDMFIVCGQNLEMYLTYSPVTVCLGNFKVEWL